MPFPHVLYCDRDSFEDALAAFGNPGPALTVLSFGREDIEAGLTGEALDRLMVLGDSADAVRKLADRVVFEVRGYDDDPRELYEIPACQRFFRALAYAWGGWLHFLEKQHALPTFLTLLVDVHVERRAGGIVSSRLTDPRQLQEVLTRLFVRMNALYAHHHLGLAARAAMSARVGKSADWMFNPPDAPHADAL